MTELSTGQKVTEVLWNTGLALILFFPAAPFVLIWSIHRQWKTRQEIVQTERPYHLVPYGVEWGGSYYHKCYCDGSVCGTIPAQTR